MTREHLIEYITMRLHTMSDRQLHKIYTFVCAFHSSK